jgi:hypothetical protein
MTEYETLLPGFSATAPKGYGVEIKTDKGCITFHAGEALAYCLTNPLKVTYTATVGDMNRRHLHEKLDAWLDANLQQEKNT